ncbi:PadR family transcriptional regulator [Rhodococcus sp. HNM0569]|uniref:PadR family transcriptional regulator n=1 Tax=Rhodococcus sp. HNM0569 TaxID=2716340 RepID=UPI00146E61D4|nr:PadR family transcriptional regulator [Rhodococcus sp. HNM0569]NLU83982.1 PadR family transcriptional regulator [Rhodococcus sp. HNM0569]
MALEHALLVALTERSGSGYELARRFDKSIGFFHGATHQQIYRTLRRMEDAGWVEGRPVPQDGRPDKKLYTPSSAGRDELARWIAEPTEPGQLRNELAVKIRAAAHGDRDALVADVRRHRDAHVERLGIYHAIEARDFPVPTELDGTDLHQYLVLRGGIRVEAGFVEWCDEVLAALTAAPTRTAAPHTEGSSS